MKNSVILFILILVYTAGFSQNYKFEYTGGINPKVNKEKLNKVNLVSEITPDLWRSMQLSYNTRRELDIHKNTDFTQVYSFSNQEFNYNNIVEYVSVEILTSSNGKIISSQSYGDKLTTAQKQILGNADSGTELDIKINFRFKNQASDKVNADSKVYSGTLTLVVIPETEAKYPGGYEKLSDFYTENIFKKVSDKSDFDKILMASVKFTVNEDGRITGAKMSKSSTDPQIDKLILEQTGKMPKWSPAKNSEGINIKQEFVIPFGGNGC
jgi:TonB family protein